MICPLLAAGVLATPTENHLARLDLASESAEVRAADRASACLESACAWWMNGSKKDERSGETITLEGCALTAGVYALAALTTKR